MKQAEILKYINDTRGLKIFELPLNSFENERIQFSLDDRPIQTINKNHLGHFFYDYNKRCEFLNTLIDINVQNEIITLIKFLNGEINKINIYHYSLVPRKSDFEKIQIANYSIVKLDELALKKFAEIHDSSNFFVNKTNYPKDYRLLIISQQEINRINDRNHHLFFDRLDEIYSKHSILTFLFDYYFGNFQIRKSKFNTDNFANASGSGSTKTFISELKGTNEHVIEKINDIMSFLDNKLYYRLIIRCEFTSKRIFEQAIFLRAILDPFFEQKKAEISKAVNAKTKKTKIQAKYVLNTLKNADSNLSNLLSLEQLVMFLEIRNHMIHPNPTKEITELHFLYDKISDIRKLVYEFLFVSIQAMKDNDIEDFELETELK